MFNWIKSLFVKKPAPKKRSKRVKEETYSAIPKHDFVFYHPESDSFKGIDKIPAKRPRLYKQSTVVTTGELPQAKEKKMAVKPSKAVAKKVTKEMEYDYKTGKKAFAGSTAKKDAHAEKEGKRVAKALAYDINKKKK